MSKEKKARLMECQYCGKETMIPVGMTCCPGDCWEYYKSEKSSYLPTEEEIAKACAEIRAKRLEEHAAAIMKDTRSIDELAGEKTVIDTRHISRNFILEEEWS